MGSSGVRRGHVVAAVVVIAVVSPITTWWRVGDLSCSCPSRHGSLDYAIEAPTLSSTTANLIGGGSTAVGFVALVVVADALRRRIVAFSDIRIAIPLVAAGVYAGLAWRTETAGVIGANIGGGIMLLGAPFVGVFLLIWAVLWRPRGLGGSGTSMASIRDT